MTLRTGLLNGNNITQDYDFGYMLQAIATGGYIEGLEVQTGKVVAGKGFVPCVRTNGNKPFVFVELSADFVVDTTGTKKVWIEVPQAKLDDGSLNNEDGTDIATISTGASYPAGNYIPLASITGGTITDERTKVTVKADAFIFSKSLRDLLDVYNFTTPTTKKFLVFDTGTNKWTTGTVDASDVPQATYLSDSFYFSGETGVAGDYLFPESSPTYTQATGIQNIGDVTANTRGDCVVYSTGVYSSTFKMGLKKFVSPSVNFSFRLETDNAGASSGALVDPNSIATIAPGSLTTSIANTTLTWNGAFTMPAVGTKLHLVPIVGTPGSETINATNYYGFAYYVIDTDIRGLSLWNGSAWGTRDTKKFAYIDGDCFQKIVLAKTNSLYQYKVDYMGCAKSAFDIGEYPTLILPVDGTIDNLRTNLVFGDIMAIGGPMIGGILTTNYFGVTSARPNGAGVTTYMKIVAPETCTVIGFKINLKSTHNGGGYNTTANWSFSLLADNAGVPGTSLSGSAGLTNQTTGSATYDALLEQNFTTPVSFVKGTTYWLQMGISSWAGSSGSSTTAYRPLGIHTNKCVTYDSGYTNIYNPIAILLTTDIARGKITNEISAYRAKVGVVKSSTKFENRKKLTGMPLTVTASPFTWQNTTDKPLQYYVSGGTVNPIAISKDLYTFITQSTATGYVGILAPGDYLRVTYTVLPTITYSDL